MAGFLDTTEKTGLDQAWEYVRSIQGMKDEKIRWIFGEESNLDEVFVCGVDGIHFRVQEPRWDPSSKWFSKKHNHAGLVYEIGIATWHNQLVWINGPFPAGENG